MKILIVFILAIAAVPVMSQCSLPIDKAPVLRGISLGMKRTEVVAKLGKPTMENDPFFSYMPGAIQLNNTATGDNRATPTELEGLAWLMLDTDQGKISLVSVKYADHVAWNSADEFASNISEKLKLPNAWTYDTKKTVAVLKCGDWSLTAYPGRNQIDLQDLTTFAKADEANSGKKKAFKP